MTNAEIFQKVAARELTPGQGADLMRQADADALQALCPPWLPRPVWAAGLAITAALCGVFGLSRC